MQTLQLPDQMRIVDLLRLARSQGKRLVWRPQGLRYRAQLEDTTHVDNARPIDHRPDGGLDHHRSPLPADHALAGRRRPARSAAAADPDTLAVLPVGPGGTSC